MRLTPFVGATALLASFCVAVGVLQAQKTDRLVLENGDRFTGEIKQLARGRLQFSTDALSGVKVDWRKVARLSSERTFEVEMPSGRRYYGRLAQSSQDGSLIVQGARVDTLVLQTAVSIVPISSKLVDRLRAYLDLGFSLAKVDWASSLSLNGELSYRAPEFGATLAYDGYAQAQEGEALSQRNTAKLEGQHFLGSRWSIQGLTSFEQNDELALDYRISAGAAGGRQLLLSNRRVLGVLAGVLGTSERFGGADGAKLNLEGLLGLNWEAFRFDRPKLDLKTSLVVYPSITTPGRVRAEVSARVRYEVIKDFSTGINFTDSFDSRPADADAPNNDFVLKLTIGWSYRQ